MPTCYFSDVTWYMHRVLDVGSTDRLQCLLILWKCWCFLLTCMFQKNFLCFSQRCLNLWKNESQLTRDRVRVLEIQQAKRKGWLTHLHHSLSQIPAIWILLWEALARSQFRVVVTESPGRYFTAQRAYKLWGVKILRTQMWEMRSAFWCFPEGAAFSFLFCPV